MRLGNCSLSESEVQNEIDEEVQNKIDEEVWNEDFFKKIREWL